MNQLEAAGFEVHHIQNVGIHYSITLKQWYDNWLGNKDLIIAKYGVWYFRLWVVFLGWSSIIASQVRLVVHILYLSFGLLRRMFMLLSLGLVHVLANSGPQEQQ